MDDDELTREQIEAAHDALCASVAMHTDMSGPWREQRWKQAHTLRDLALRALSQESGRSATLEEAAKLADLYFNLTEEAHEKWMAMFPGGKPLPDAIRSLKPSLLREDDQTRIGQLIVKLKEIINAPGGGPAKHIAKQNITRSLQSLSRELEGEPIPVE